MTKLKVNCRCPKGHDVVTSFPIKKGNIGNMLFNGDFLNYKIKGFCNTCKELTVLLILDVLESEKEKEDKFNGLFED